MITGFTRPLWPIRYKPQKDELLSSWLVRLSHGHGLKVQTFCNLLFGGRRQVWNRDIDRLAPSWLLEELTQRTGAKPEIANATTLRVFEGALFNQFKESGALTWMLSLQIFHRRRQGFGQQFCPSCLAEDELPYFRKTWRLALKTFCVEHNCMLMDRCPRCGNGVAFHRMDMGRADVPEDGALANCFHCRFNLASSIPQPIVSHDSDATLWMTRTIRATDALATGRRQDFPRGDLLVLRHVTSLLLTSRPHVRLREHVAGHLALDPVFQSDSKRVTVEGLNTQQRHNLLQMGAWVLAAPRERLVQAWHSRAIRFNHLLRGFETPPAWYLEIADECANWRDIGW